jgi:hypothetical protein
MTFLGTVQHSSGQSEEEPSKFSNRMTGKLSDILTGCLKFNV